MNRRRSWQGVWKGLLAAFMIPGLMLPDLASAAPAQIEAPKRPFAATENHLESFDAAWRIIHETYFDPGFGGVDWEAVRKELRPRAGQAENVQELRGIIEEMLQKLGGSHMALIPREVAYSLEGSAEGEEPSGRGDLAEENSTELSKAIELPEAAGTPSGPGSGRRDGDVGLEVRVRERRAIITRVDRGGPAAQAGIQPGWILQEVNHEPIGEMLEALPTTLDPLRSQFVEWGLVTGKLAGRPGSSVSISLLDGQDQWVALTLTRRQRPGEPAKIGYLPTLYAHLEREPLSVADGGTIGLIRFNLWMIPIVRALDASVDQFRKAEGIVIDLRGNLGGVGGMILGVSGHFLNERVSLGTLKMRGNELSFFANPRRVNAAGERVEPYSGPLAILIDGLSLSAAEIFAGGMQDVGRARLFGERSGGQALPAIWDRLPNGDVLYHAFGDFITPSGARLEGRGVAPDEPVALSRADLLAGRDAPLQAALRWIQQQRVEREPVKAAVP